MKKWVLTGLVLIAVVAMATSGAMAQDRDARRPGGQRPDPAAVIKTLGLNAEAEAASLQLLETHKQTVANWDKENAPAMEAVKKKFAAAKEAKDRDAYKAASEEMRELMAGKRELFEGLNASLRDILTEEQMAKFNQALRGGGGQNRPKNPFEALRMVGPSEEQRAQAQEILQVAKGEANRVDDPAKKKEIFDAALKNIVENVLTDAQRKKFEAIMAGGQQGGGERIQFTDDQKTQMQEIQAEARKAAEAAQTDEERREIMGATRKRIFEEVLTDEQREALKKRQHGGGDRRRGDHRPGTDAAK